MRPATELPWGEYNAKRGRIFKHWRIHASPVAQPVVQPALAVVATGIQDAAYIAHAANAYPHLVAALQGLFKECAMVHKHWGDGSNAKEANAAQTAALCLLVSLGEET